MSTTLRRVQADFQDFLLHGGTAVQQHVVGTRRVPLATRLAIYGDAYRSRLAEALASNFPALARLLGETDFERLANEYVRTHESPFFSIRYYGDALTQFLGTHEEYVAAPVLAELARWEWAITTTFDALDAMPLSHPTLARVPPQQWPRLRFEWHPSVQRLTLAWNVPQLWQALTDEVERPPAELAATPVHWLLWRRDLTTCYRSLPQTEAAVLDAARSGWPFGELCELLCDEVGEEEAPAASASLLRGWVDSGLIVGAA